MRTTKAMCPCLALDCPYYHLDKDGECGIDDPLNECDDFVAFGGAILMSERTAFE